ncbi:phosphoglycerate mutase family protein [Limosilactobacillus sp. STM2_1]|uniref:Phosphoglycerate mutase family protein n=1 Tax=Limosilactobacillus rudii TaxID=2759755 RepID=A0A7W3ULG7_9LACO|nr:phosphoglycerate mutase family protein [Limosilactobacillus rudii]MBB1079656.1 phosphoglycerate mutase family protein [Limosilactobacillus rudii]MBB1097734.1 phosphoglycerate mutase family protein [Limosilactobacillus rudii]MCD7134354.1 histidine phosphatase family protein [Limosilactobacillus rudii]
MTKLNIYLVRHGQTFFNIYNKLQGWSNSPLTSKGKEDAKLAGEKLQNIHFDGAFCSDTTRAIETIQTILNMNRRNSVKQPITAPYFREEFYGSYEGINMDVAWYNAGAPHGLKTFHDIVVKYSIGRAKDWLKEADPFHDAENNEEYWQRLDKGLALIRNADLPDNANVLWVSHGNTLLSLVERFGHGKYDVTVRPDNGSLTTAVLTDKDMQILEYNK